MATALTTTEQTTAPAAFQASPEQAHFQFMQRKASLYASSPLIPETLRAGGPQVALSNCYIGLAIAERMGENELTVLQNIHIVKGKAGFSAQFMIARANASGVFKGRINWRMTGAGDTLSAEAYATLADTGEEVSFAVDMGMAKAEGWTTNPKYKSVPHLMLRYRSATFLIRLYAPEVMFGYRTAEEAEDMGFATSAPQELTPQPLTATALLEQAHPSSGDGSAPAGDPLPHEPSDEAVQEGRDDGQMGEAVTLASAKAEIDAAELVMDVNNRTAALLDHLDEDDAAELRQHALDRIATLKARAK